ncbi:hypothetical protein PAPYR_12640 [Paratrimastix pyriformis]|uniref:Uncharacterized protein n=1 Tax=Paratrimastix pyriformis TaxID=342808 RepID=A0ABQ8U3S3_9EUKA|nr:hypothetical protein PAPYR_12640 [Paratrimastix pyriformis]
MLVVSLLAMSQTLRSHSPVFHLGLIDLVAREGEYSERSESLLNNRPVVLWGQTSTSNPHFARTLGFDHLRVAVLSRSPCCRGARQVSTRTVRPGSRLMALMICGHTGAHVPAAQLAGFYNNAHCELLPLQHTGGCKRGASSILARTRGAANSPVSDRRHDDSMSHMEPWRSPPHVSEEASCARHAWATTPRGTG